ncbi:ABC transporter substrate-binding protein [Paenibacillus senegalensis]|uniref:ABC transporter substrate-binding protein n=1 Tax=Paenibacillus senegalensis TaxID=1465766 RepID=UPI00028A2F01|nr:ABC transporter substrate-binding protein [Paenibacillus senegalensis]
MKRMKNQSLMALLLVISLLVLSACGAGGESHGSEGNGKKKIRIGYLPITHAAPLYLEQGLEKEGYEIELVKFGSWPDLMDALNTGHIDGASVLVQLAMRAKEQGIDLKTVALGHKDGNVLVAGQDIEDVTDLRGQSYAIPSRFSSHNILLYEMLKQAGVGYDEVNVIELAPPEMPVALAEGRISGYVVAEPFGASSVAAGHGKVLFQSDELWPNSVCCVLVLRQEWIDSNPELTQKVVQKYVEAGLLAEHKDDHAKAVLGNFLNVNEEVLDLSLGWIHYDDLVLDEESYRKLSEYLVEMGLTENPPAYEDFVDNTFIERALQSL